MVHARRPYTLGALPATGGEVMPTKVPALRVEARHAGHGREEGGVREHASAQGGEVMAPWSGAILRVLAAGSPRGCAKHSGSQPWEGGVPGRGLSRPPPPDATLGVGGAGPRGPRVAPCPPGTPAGVRPRAAGG